jgi:solute carrier family 25 phosphate transporter 23/24/25/41
MPTTHNTSEHSKRDTYEATVSGAQTTPLLPHLRSDPPPYRPIPHTLEDFRSLEGRAERKTRLRELWDRLPQPQYHGAKQEALAKTLPMTGLTPEAAEKLKEMYDEELLGRCGGATAEDPGSHRIGWRAFVKYAEAKEAGMRSALRRDPFACN